MYSTCNNFIKYMFYIEKYRREMKIVYSCNTFPFINPNVPILTLYNNSYIILKNICIYLIQPYAAFI